MSTSSPRPALLGCEDLRLLLAAKGRFLAGFVCVCILLAVIVYFCLLPREWASEAVVVISPESGGGLAAALSSMPQVFAGLGKGTSPLVLANQAERILTSRCTLDAVWEKAGLSQYFDCPGKSDRREFLLEHTEIEKHIYASTLVVRVALPGSPRIAGLLGREDMQVRQIARRIADCYLDELLRQASRLINAAATIRRQFLERRLKQVEQELRRAEEELAKWEREHGMADAQAAANLLRSQLQQVWQILIEAEAEAEAAKSALRQLSEYKSGISEQRVEREQEQMSPVVDQLTAWISQSEARIMEMTAVQGMTEEHPKVRAERARLEQLKKRLEEELAKGLQTRLRTTGANPVADALKTQELESRVSLVTATAKARAARGVLKRLEAERKRLPDDVLQFLRLSQRVEARRTIYSTLLAQYEDALLSEQAKSTQFLVLDYPEVPERPAGLKIEILLPSVAIAALIVGLIWSVLTFSAPERFAGQCSREDDEGSYK